VPERLMNIGVNRNNVVPSATEFFKDQGTVTSALPRDSDHRNAFLSEEILDSCQRRALSWHLSHLRKPECLAFVRLRYRSVKLQTRTGGQNEESHPKIDYGACGAGISGTKQESYKGFPNWHLLKIPWRHSGGAPASCSVKRKP
jgi:hypothetical protein